MRLWHLWESGMYVIPWYNNCYYPEIMLFVSEMWWVWDTHLLHCNLFVEWMTEEKVEKVDWGPVLRRWGSNLGTWLPGGCSRIQVCLGLILNWCGFIGMQYSWNWRWIMILLQEQVLGLVPPSTFLCFKNSCIIDKKFHFLGHECWIQCCVVQPLSTPKRSDSSKKL